MRARDWSGHLKDQALSQRIPRTPENAKTRLEFVRKWVIFNGWKDVVFSDECSVQRKANNSANFVFRFSGEAYPQGIMNLVDHGKDISQMIWGAIWINGRSNLVVMERDDNSPRGGYTTNSYVNCLEEGLLEYLSARQCVDTLGVTGARVI